MQQYRCYCPQAHIQSIMKQMEGRGALVEAALRRGPKYFEYEDFPIPLSEDQVDNFEVIAKIGRGKYSDVFKAIRITSKGDELCVLKILKPIRMAKVKREVKVMLTLKHPSIIALQNVMMDPISKSYVLAMSFSEGVSRPQQPLTLAEISAFLKKLLEGLQYCHSSGIMHRDIKPENVLLDRAKGELKIIDWGLAEYYLPQRDYNVRVASRYYKAPELLLNNHYYDYAIDMWSVGCWLAGMLFNKGVFFRGEDNIDQLFKIGEIRGSHEIREYVKRFGLKPQPRIKEWLQAHDYPKIPLSMFRNRENQEACSDQALDLLQRLLAINHTERITAEQALSHHFFAATK